MSLSIRLLLTALLFVSSVSVSTVYPPHLPKAPGCDVSGTAPYIQVTGVTSHAEGAGLDFGDINRNGRPDLVIMANHDPVGRNAFRYKIGWDVNFHTGRAKSWSSRIQVTGVGRWAQGASVALADIDGNGVLDMVLMAHDNPGGANNFRYKIGWNLGTNGRASTWSPYIKVNGLGDEGNGSGLAIADLDGNGELDIVLMAYGSSRADLFEYKVGWDLDSSGRTSDWSADWRIGGTGWASQGADLAIADVDLDHKLDLVLMSYDNPHWNNFRYRIGWHIQPDGWVKEWSRWYMVRGVGTGGEGAGLAYRYDPQVGPRLAFMAYDSAADSFRYMLLPLTTSGATYGIADDYPPAADNRLSVPSGYDDLVPEKLFNLNMSLVQETAQDALSLYLFYCMLDMFDGKVDVGACRHNYPDADVNSFQLFGHPRYSREITPDHLVAAVAMYVDENMWWTPDDLNAYVLNQIHSLSYVPGGDAVPTYYTLHYTDPSRYPEIISQLAAENALWAEAYSTGHRYHGDCEDFAILRHALLRALGFDRNFVWNAAVPGHEFNLVLYKGTYRIIDYGQFYSYFCHAGGKDELAWAWNQALGVSDPPRFFSEYLLERVHPDRCRRAFGWLFTRRASPDLDWVPWKPPQLELVGSDRSKCPNPGR